MNQKPEEKKSYPNDIITGDVCYIVRFPRQAVIYLENPEVA